MGYYIAVDIGGTQLRAVCFPKNDTQPVKISRTSTLLKEKDQKPQKPFDRLVELITSVYPPEKDVIAIGSAAPSPLAPNILEWHIFRFCSLLENIFNVPVALIQNLYPANGQVLSGGEDANSE